MSDGPDEFESGAGLPQVPEVDACGSESAAGSAAVQVAHAALSATVEGAASRFSGPAPICEPCGYDLRGSIQGGRCPECGWPIDPSARGYCVRDGRLWVRPGCVLPRLCVATGEPVAAGARDSTLGCRSPMAVASAVLMVPLAACVLLLGLAYCWPILLLPPLLIAHQRLAANRACPLVYFVSPMALWRRRLVMGSVQALSITPPVVAWAWPTGPLWGSRFVLLAIGLLGWGAAELWRRFSTLRVDRFDGRRFRVRGCCPRFLEAISAPGAR